MSSYFVEGLGTSTPEKVVRQVGLPAVDMGRLRNLKNAVERSKDDFYREIFTQLIKAGVVRYKWRMCWGIVAFKDFHGNGIDNDTVDNLFTDTNDLAIEHNSSCDAMWDASYVFTSNNGDSEYCPAIDELGTEATPFELADWFGTTLNPDQE